MEGDDELLAEEEVTVAPQREEWMTTLPPERKVSLFQCFLVFYSERLPFLVHTRQPYAFSLGT